MSPYETLGVRKGAHAATIKKAYRKLAARLHPDRNPGDPEAAERFAAVQAAWELLSDPARRARYDATGDTSNHRAHPDGLDFVEVLIPALLEALNQAAQRGTTTTDVVAAVRELLSAARRRLEERRGQIDKARTVLKTAMERLVYEGEGEDLLASALRNQLAGVESDAAGTARDLDRHTRALAYLTKCRYRTDPKKGTMDTTINVGWISAGSWGTIT